MKLLLRPMRDLDSETRYISDVYHAHYASLSFGTYPSRASMPIAEALRSFSGHLACGYLYYVGPAPKFRSLFAANIADKASMGGCR